MAIATVAASVVGLIMGFLLWPVAAMSRRRDVAVLAGFRRFFWWHSIVASLTVGLCVYAQMAPLQDAYIYSVPPLLVGLISFVASVVLIIGAARKPGRRQSA